MKKKLVFTIIGLMAIITPVTVFGGEPKKVSVTAYCEGDIGCKGDAMREGIIAGMPSQYGMKATLYKDNSGEPGELIGKFEILDCGYGKSTGRGESRIKPGKPLGTIETGESLDVYRTDYDRCVEFMKQTGGSAFVVFEE